MPRVLRTVNELRTWRRSLAADGPVAFVPTMGYLHDGHLSLLHEARRQVPAHAGPLVLSIFVNPTQFGPHEDLDRYPRDEARDLALAHDCGVDVAFCPHTADELYPSRDTWVNVQGLDEVLCGRTRPGHFRGVCTVVAKLLNLVAPQVSVFGRKDYQQLAIIRRMHADLFLPGTVADMPIVREPDGLAMSSRNTLLSPEARDQARAISRWLNHVSEGFERGQRRVDMLLRGATEALAPGRLDYAEIVDAQDLSPVETITRPALCALAAHFGGVRLIDNTVLHP